MGFCGFRSFSKQKKVNKSKRSKITYNSIYNIRLYFAVDRMNISYMKRMECGTLKVLHLKSHDFANFDVIATGYSNLMGRLLGLDLNEYLDISFRTYLQEKCKSDSTSDIVFVVPHRVRQLCETKDLNMQLQRMRLSKKVRFVKDKIRINSEIWTRWLSEYIESALAVLDESLQENDISGVKTALLFGKCACFPLAVENLQKKLPNVIIPNDVDVAKISGACIYGHMPDILQSRIVESFGPYLVKEVFLLIAVVVIFDILFLCQKEMPSERFLMCTSVHRIECIVT